MIIILKLFESVLTGIKEIFHNKTRSFLTMLGITLGVASLITMASIVEGAKVSTLAIMNQWGGLNKVSLRYTSSDSAGMGMGDFTFGAKQSGITLKDINDLYSSHSDIIDTISPQLFARGAVKRGNKTLYVHRIIGVTPSFEKVEQYEVESGRDLSMFDDWGLARVCVIGTILKDELFEEYEDAVGQKIEVEGVPLTIIGVYKNYQMSDPLRPDKPRVETTKKEGLERAIKAPEQNKRLSGHGFWRKYGAGNVLWYKNFILCVPFSTIQMAYRGDNYIDIINILLKSPDGLTQKVESMSRTLKATRGAEDFEFNTAAENYEMMNKQINIFNIVLGSIAAISLIVGGIGIMNVILASISQRIREIGVRKSVGASDLDIFIQFLIETIIIAMSGGLVGILLSFFSASLIANLSGLNASISLSSIILSLTFSGLVGVIFGIYPAIKASRLNPITALRYE